MLALAPTVGSSSFAVIVTCFAIATFSYAALSTVILNPPVIGSAKLGRVGQRHGRHGAGFGTIGAIYLTGWVADNYSFEPILLGASAVPLVGLAAMLLLVRNNAATRAGDPRNGDSSLIPP